MNRVDIVEEVDEALDIVKDKSSIYYNKEEHSLLKREFLSYKTRGHASKASITGI